MAHNIQDTPFSCPLCHTPLPEERRAHPWCKCGWKLARDPLRDMRGWRRAWARIGRRAGDVQARWDAAWMAHEEPHARPGWRMLNGFIFLLSVALYLIPFGLLVTLTVLAIRSMRSSLFLALILLALVVGGVALWDPVRWPFPTRGSRSARARRRDLHLEYTRVPQALLGVAERLGVRPPDQVGFSPFPVLFVRRTVRWSFPPRLERVLVIGLPLLAVLNVSEFKALAGHTLLFTKGRLTWLSQYVYRMLIKLSGFLRFILAFVAAGVVSALLFVIPFLLLFMISALLRGETWFSDVVSQAFSVYGGLFGPVILLLIVGWVTLSLLMWLLAAWYRRRTLLTDRAVAGVYGSNVLLAALPKLWASRRSFDLQWRGMMREIGKTPEKANLYVQFRRRWENLPEVYKEKALYEVTLGYRTFLYFQSLFEDRAALLDDLPTRLCDDRPAAVLMPGVTELSRRMTRDFLGIPEDDVPRGPQSAP